MTPRSAFRSAPLLAALLATTLSPLTASAQANPGKAIYEKLSPSLVVVQYVWENEARRQEITAVGIVIGEGGLVVTPLITFSPAIPDEQMKDFKIIIPKQDTDHEELDATFLGRDERHQLAFVKIKDPAKAAALPIVKFVDKSVDVGDTLFSVGMLPKDSGYKTYLNTATNAVRLRGETAAYLVSGPLVNVGGVVTNTAGDAIGFVFPQGEAPFFLFDPRLAQAGAQTRFFVPTFEFAPGLAAIPEAGKPQSLPFSGIFGLTGLSKDVAEVFGLVGKPAVEIGEVIPNTPAALAGLEKGMIITEIDGQPIERADQPEELGGILGRKLLRKNVGDTVTFTVIKKRGDAPTPVKITLTERPAQPNTAKRFFAEDLGYTARETVFIDLYRKKLPPDTKGVIVDFVKQSSQAATARLARGDLVTQMNGQPVTDLASFRAAYEAFRKERPKEAIVLQVNREGATQILRIEPPQ